MSSGSMDTDQDRAAIREVWSEWFRCMQAGDIERQLGLLADDFVLKMPAQPAITSRDRMREKLHAFHAAMGETVEYEIEEIAVVGDWAWARITERVSLEDRRTAEHHSFSGLHLAILKRASDGPWKIARDVASLDMPL